MDWDLNKGEILKTYKNDFDWLKTIFFMKERIRDHFCKVSSDLKPFWQVTIFHTRLPHKPNKEWDLNKGEILKTYKNDFDWLKMIFFMKEDIRDHFAKFQVISSYFDKLPYFTPDFPTNQIMDWDLD